MRMFKLFILILPAVFLSHSFAAEDAPAERAARPQREAVKLSPGIRPSAPRPDDSGKLKRAPPPRAESPLQNVPALMPPTSPSSAKP